jgi:hypothetical protein
METLMTLWQCARWKMSFWSSTLVEHRAWRRVTKLRMVSANGATWFDPALKFTISSLHHHSTTMLKPSIDTTISYELFSDVNSDVHRARNAWQHSATYIALCVWHLMHDSPSPLSTENMGRKHNITSDHGALRKLKFLVPFYFRPWTNTDPRPSLRISLANLIECHAWDTGALTGIMHHWLWICHFSTSWDNGATSFCRAATCTSVHGVARYLTNVLSVARYLIGVQCMAPAFLWSMKNLLYNLII